jgi:hypothetical protein
MFRVFFFISSLLYIENNIHAQCCSPGNPVGGDANQGVMNKGSIKIIPFVKNSTSEYYFEGSKKSSDFSFVDKGTFLFSGLSLAWGITQKITFENEIGYFIHKTQQYITPSGKKQLSGYGFSDMAIIGKYRIYNNTGNEIEVTFGGGYKFPLGNFQQRNKNGILLPIDIQPTTGTQGFIASIFLYKGFLQKKLKFFLNSRAVFTPRPAIFTEIIPKKYYQYGNFYMTSLFAAYAASHRWSIIFQLRGEYREMDKFKFEGENSYRDYLSSGGYKLFGVPQLMYSFRNNLSVSCSFDAPVYQYYNQKQLATLYAFSFMLTKTIDGLYKNSLNNKVVQPFVPETK